MPVNNRKNPFVLAPALTLVVLVLLLFFRLFDAQSAIAQIFMRGVLVSLAFFIPLAVYLALRGRSLPQILPLFGMRAQAWRLSLAALVSLILWDSLFRYGILRAALPAGHLSLYGLSVPYPETLAEAVLAVFFVALLPAILEEAVFRGALFYEYRFLDPIWTVVISALLSACLGTSFPAFFALLYRALCFALVRYLTGSLAGAIAVHAGYAVFSLFLEKYFALSALAEESLPLYRLVLTVALGVSAFFFFHHAEGCLRARRDEPAPATLSGARRQLARFDCLTAPPLALFAVVFLIAAIVRLLL